jgi:PIN domain nuclease of toxin-antitoxin system
MTPYLLDTHIFIWNAIDKKKLSRQIRDELDDLNNLCYLSRISLMEIAIKNRDGDLSLGEDYKEFVKNIDRFGIKILEIDNRHLFTLNQLTYLQNHKDPFDHLIISQAISSRYCLISADSKMPFYKKQGLDLFEA